MERTLKDLFLELSPAGRTIAIAAVVLFVVVLVLAVAGYRSASHARDLVLEENTLIKAQRDDYQAAAKKAVEDAAKARAALLAEEKRLNEINKDLDAARQTVAALQKGLDDRRDEYYRARRLSDDELDKLRATLKR